MAKLTSHPVDKEKGGIIGTARVPGDKSISHRALIIGAMAEGETEISGLLESGDVLCTARALSSLGVDMTPAISKNDTWRLRGDMTAPLKPPRSAIYLGNSGTSARLLMGLIAGNPVSAKLLGDTSLSARPMGRAIKPLAQMGARFETTSGDRLPLRVTGSSSLRPVTYTLPVPSAQVKSAIILAALGADGETTITEPVATRDHTERMLRLFGADIHSDNNTVVIRGGGRLSGQSIVIPGDSSSAAFPVVAALITPHSDIIIPNVGVNPGRIGLYETLREMGALISFENPRESSGEPVADIRVRSSRLKGVTVPASRAASMIDEYPILSIAAACAEGTTRMLGLSELRVKESDRLAAIAAGLAACGVKAEIDGDDLTVHGLGHGPDGGCALPANADHRMAMSFLVLGMVAKAPIVVTGADTIKTSFPDFTELLNSLGAHITSEDSPVSAAK